MVNPLDLFLDINLCKATDTNPTHKQGVHRGGDYAARVQEGYEKDGSPKYKYFKTIEARDKYLERKRGTKEGAEDLKDKTKEEQKRSKEATGGLLLKEKDDKKSDKKKDKKVKKSVDLYVGDK